jgi:hypothetical protein
MALVPQPATAIMLKKKGIYGHPEEGILQRRGRALEAFPTRSK